MNIHRTFVTTDVHPEPRIMITFNNELIGKKRKINLIGIIPNTKCRDIVFASIASRDDFAFDTTFTKTRSDKDTIVTIENGFNVAFCDIIEERAIETAKKYGNEDMFFEFASTSKITFAFIYFILP